MSVHNNTDPPKLVEPREPRTSYLLAIKEPIGKSDSSSALSVVATGQAYVVDMLVLGIAVEASRSVARCIVVQPGDPSGQVLEKRELSYDGADQPTGLYDMSKAFRTLLKEKDIGCVVIKQADPSRNAPRAASLNRLMAEGALAAAAPGTAPTTLLLAGNQCARLLNASKEDAVNAAKEASRSLGLTQVWADAIFAARAAEAHSLAN